VFPYSTPFYIYLFTCTCTCTCTRLKALLYDHTSYYLISHTILVHSKRSGGADETSVVESVDGDGDSSTVRALPRPCEGLTHRIETRRPPHAAPDPPCGAYRGD
jgi:hypothetical protein